MDTNHKIFQETSCQIFQDPNKRVMNYFKEMTLKKTGNLEMQYKDCVMFGAIFGSYFLNIDLRASQLG